MTGIVVGILFAGICGLIGGGLGLLIGAFIVVAFLVGRSLIKALDVN